MTQDPQRIIEDLVKRVAELERLMRFHNHNGLDSSQDMRATKTFFYGDIQFPYVLNERGGRDAYITTPNGFGMEISEAIGASQFATVTLRSQTGTIVTGGTSSNGEVGLYDGSGSSSKYFKLAHSGNGNPVIITDALPTSSAGLASGTLWNDLGTVKVA